MTSINTSALYIGKYTKSSKDVWEGIDWVSKIPSYEYFFPTLMSLWDIESMDDRSRVDLLR